MHPLANYLAQHRLTQSDAALATGVAGSTISRVLGGKRQRFSVEAARRIVKWLDGALTLEQVLGCVVPAKQKRSRKKKS